MLETIPEVTSLSQFQGLWFQGRHHQGVSQVGTGLKGKRWFIRCLVLAFSLGMVCMDALATQKAGERGPLDDSERFFILANLEFTILHEFSHLLMEELQLPVLGMEEDAADRIALVAMQEFRRHQRVNEAIPWLFAVAGDWYTEWEIKAGEGGQGQAPAYWDDHPLEIQRFYNIVCLIFGGNGGLLDDLVNAELLPIERAMECDGEYQQASRAVQWLVDNYGRPAEAGITLRPEGVTVSYERPLPGQNQQMHDLLQTSQLAEQLARRLSAGFKLPRPVKIEFENCVSNPDAYWHSPTASVTVCYELAGHFREMVAYRRQHSQRACGIPSLRSLMGRHLRCEDQIEADATK